MARLTHKEWRKTPYAGTRTTDPDRAISNLLGKYDIIEYEMVYGIGPSGRRAMRLRFRAYEATYKFELEVLDADADEEQLMRQIKRVLYFQLKALLEMTCIFLSLEEALFAFREVGEGGQTVYELVSPRLDGLPAPDVANLLPAPRDKP